MTVTVWLTHLTFATAINYGAHHIQVDAICSPTKRIPPANETFTHAFQRFSVSAFQRADS